jgi:hypothetical protein
MEALQHLGVLIDTALVIIVIGVVLKSSKKQVVAAPSNNVNVQEIEQSLRKVISDAEESSLELNRELQKRQKSLEQLLFDLEGAEQRAERSRADADQRISALNNAIEAAGNVEIRPARRDSKNTAILNESHRPQAQEFVREEAPIEDAEISSVKASSQAVNIFGEPIGNLGSEEIKPLTRKIEVEKTSNNTAAVRKSDNDLRAGIHKIYDRAKELLSAGHSVAEVCAATRLPATTVQRIEELVASQTISVPQEPQQSTAQRDPRLGALGDMRRSREVI